MSDRVANHKSWRARFSHYPVATSSSKNTKMSQPPPPHEEGELEEDNGIKNEGMMSTSGSGGGVSKRDLEIMKGIVDHLTEAKDEK